MKQNRRIEHRKRDGSCLTVHKFEWEWDTWGWSLAWESGVFVVTDVNRATRTHWDGDRADSAGEALHAEKRAERGLAKDTEFRGPVSTSASSSVWWYGEGRSRVIWSTQNFLLTPATIGKRRREKWAFLPIIDTEVSGVSFQKLALNINWLVPFFHCCFIL